MRRSLALLAVPGVVLLSPSGALASWVPGAAGSGVSSARTIGVPTAVAAAATSDTSIRVTWSAPTGGGVTPTQYAVARTAPTTTTVCTVGSATFSCDDTGLTDGTTYTYTVTARVGANWRSGASSPASATTPVPGPFRVTIGGGSKTAGTPFTVDIRATTNGSSTDTSYAGLKTADLLRPRCEPVGDGARLSRDRDVHCGPRGPRSSPSTTRSRRR